MVIRTVSQLPTVNYEELHDSESVSFVEVSHGNEICGEYVYISKKTTVADLGKAVATDLSTTMVRDHEMEFEDGSTIKIRSDLFNPLSILGTQDTSVYGIKEFKDYPWISAEMPTEFDKYGGNSDFIIPNMKKVKTLVADSPSFVSTTSSYIADGDPFRDLNGNHPSTKDVEMIVHKYTIEPNDGKFYSWTIESGNTDSSQKHIDGITDAREEFQEMRDDGQLVVWGWLADSGVVSPEHCWVGIFGYMKYEDESGQNSMIYAPIQIQPWIRGSNASKLQYVGFNVPVRKGLRLKIRTGFAVSASQGSAFQNPGSLTFRDKFVANTFFGYIIKNSSN